MGWLLPLLSALLFLIVGALCARYYIHMLQLEGYKLHQYGRWLLRNASRGMIGMLSLVAGLVVALGLLLLRVDSFMAISCGLSAALVVMLIHYVVLRSSKPKKDLVCTSRIKRLYGAVVLLNAVVCLAGVLLFFVDEKAILLLMVILPLQPLVVYAAAFLMQPAEKAVHRYYMRDAKRQIDQRTDLIKIGITGSYGKTSAKFFLGTILSEKYETLVTPESYNTPMGLCRTIREHLLPKHQVFVAEMGARNIGDIEELCRLVRPSYGLITSVGKQHLETFGSLENVVRTKYELIQALPEDGMAFFPATDIGRQMYERTAVKKALFGFLGDNLFITAKNIEVGPYGSRFELVADGQEVACRTRLLGVHNIMNLLGAAAVASVLGLSLKEIARGIAKIEPVPHRLQLMDPGNGVIIIDDAFNSNPAGSAAALEVLSGFEGYRKIVVTPGMVELGDEEQEENKLFGSRMAKVADYCILVGEKRTRPIYDGLVEAGFSKEHIFVVDQLAGASAALASLTRPGDVVLFENDLPDNYNE
jgi:UDP-N-acetylmuramoyl-tripeptide--D-alanyl-D-alanine ligase